MLELLLPIATLILSIIVATLAAKREGQKLNEELKLNYSVEAILRKLLENKNYKTRTLKKIKYHVRGFKDDNELRMALLRAGAVVVKQQEKQEYWGLLSRNADAVK